MSKKANPVTIGLFVSIAFLLAILSVVYLGAASAFQRNPEFVLYFEDSVNGLSEGSPVKFKGVPVGKVTKILIRKNQADSSDHIPVVIEINAEYVKTLGVSDKIDNRDHLDKQIREMGFRGKLEFISYVTGLLYVELDFHPEAKVPEYVQLPDQQEYLEIPTLKSSISDIQKRVAEAAASLSGIDLPGISAELKSVLRNTNDLITAIPVSDLTADLKASLARLRALLESGEVEKVLVNLSTASATFNEYGKDLREMTPEVAQKLTSSLDQLNLIMTDVKKITDTRYGVSATFMTTLEKVGQASDSVRRLSNFIERNPNALLTGRE